MKAASAQAESPKEQSTSNESDEEAWGDKLVIDLDTSANMTDNKTQAKSVATSEGDDYDNICSKSSSSFKTMRADAASGKQKGKRNGQKRGNESNKNEGTSNSKWTGKPGKMEKEKASVGKPGRKRKEKQSPVSIKTEGENANDPYKFEPSDEKIGSTAIGMSDGKSKSTTKSSKDAQTEYDWRSVGSLTEPEHLGPCEPGTQVCLEGIVWQETSNGVLVVNVTWKGKTYMGTLLDATKHDWSPPSCDSPTGDFEGRTPKGRGKRSRVPLSDAFKDINERKLRKEMRKQSGQNHPRPRSPTSPKSESGKRKIRSSEGDSSESTSKRGRSMGLNHSPPVLIECPQPNCGKKYKQMNGLKYHQRNAHHGTPLQVPSDNTSEEPEKPEPASSPEDSKLKSTCDGPGDVDAGSPALIDQSDSPVRTNTTSVITPTTANVTNTTTPPSGNVPVATITPQVVKPVGLPTETSDQNRNSAHGNQFTTSNGRPDISSAPPQLISKPTLSSNAMAPISTITSPSAYNSTLKPIQPKPTIMGEAAPNPGLHDLIDQKKLKRKRSLGKEEVDNSTYGQVDTPKGLIGGMHKFETEHRGLLSTGGMMNTLTDPASLLQSPAYSDISDEGDLKYAARRDLLASSSRSNLNLSDSSMHSQNLYPIATVSPQKNPPLAEKDTKKNLNRQIPSHSPVLSRPLEDKHRQLQYLPGQPPWGQPDMMIQQLMMQGMASKEKTSRPVSPKPPSFKPTASTLGRDIDPRVSGDRLQLLKEDMKVSALLPRHDAPRDYTVSPNTSSSNELNYHETKQREYEDSHKRELMKNMPSVNKHQSLASNKLPDNRLEKVPSQSSPMPPPGSGSFFSPYMSNAFLQQQMAAMQMNPAMLARMAMPAAFPPHLLNMATDNKDGGNTALPSFSGNSKSNHKIHELEGVQSSKSPRPVSNERQNSKNLPMTSQTAAMHQVLSMNQAFAGMFPPPK